MLGTLIAAVGAGIAAMWFSRAIRLPAIGPLLILGVLLGPEVLGLVQPAALGESLRPLVAMAVALVLFEGALTLDLRGLGEAPVVIRRLVSIGALVTWLGGAFMVWWLLDLAVPEALLAGALVMVTGPTVIAPILRRVTLRPNLHHILHWEGVLIDPVGVFIAVLCYELITLGEDPTQALGLFALRIVAGAGVGAAGGFFIRWVLFGRRIPEDLVNVFVLSVALGTFGLSDAIAHEAGILAVIVAGLIVGVGEPPHIEEIRSFKEELTYPAIGVLFIILAARLELAQFQTLGGGAIVVILLLMFVARPLNIFVSTAGRGIALREKLFLSWIAPRGIVAASMASLFAIELAAQNHPRAAFFEPFTYAVIFATALLQGSTAGPVAQLLGVRRPERQGWLIVGAHRLGRELALFLRDVARVPVLLIDRNDDSVHRARAVGLTAMRGDALHPSLDTRPELAEIGQVLALTNNEAMNLLVAEHWGRLLGAERVFRWGRPERLRASRDGGTAVWGRTLTPSRLSNALEAGQSRLASVRSGEAASARGIVLLSSAGDRLRPVEQPDVPADSELALLLVRAPHAPDALLRDELFIQCRAKTAPEVLSALVTAAHRVVPELLPARIESQLLEQMESYVTAIGNSVAIPHAYSKALETPLCVVAQVPDGVDFGAHDGKAVRLFFLLLSPPDDPEGHLQRLAHIARVAVDPELVEALVQAPDAATARDLLRSVPAL